MNAEQAQTILGVDDSATTAEVYASFRRLALTAHPDHGGNQEELAKLLEARDLLLEVASKSTALISADAAHAIAALAVRQATAEMRLASDVANLKDRILIKSTNRLKHYRSIVAIAGALFGASMFLKDAPLGVLSLNSASRYEYKLSATQGHITSLNRELEKLEAERMKERSENKVNEIGDRMAVLQSERSVLLDESNKLQAIGSEIKAMEENRKRSWDFVAFFAAVTSGLAAWYYSLRIGKVEEKLLELEEQTASKTVMYRFLREIFAQEIPPAWTLDKLSEAVNKWSREGGAFQAIVNEVGSLKFSLLILRRAQQMELVKTLEGFNSNSGEYQEQFSVGGSGGT